MNIFSVIAIGIIIAVMCIILKQHQPEYALLLSLAGGIFIIFTLVPQIEAITFYIEDLMEKTVIPAEYSGIIFKTLGICFATEIAAGTCKDAGESATASKIEMAGKLAVLVVSLPLFGQVLDVVYRLLN